MSDAASRVAKRKADAAVARPSSILPFAGHVGDVDYRAVRVVAKTCTMGDASRYFAAADFDYLVLHDQRIPIGVVNKYDLVRYNMTHEVDLTRPVSELMVTQVITVQSDESVFESLMFMIKHNIEFLLIMDGKEVRGIVDQAGWLALQTEYPTELLQRITAATSVEQLAEARRAADGIIWQNFVTKRDAVSLTRTVTIINDAVTRVAITLCLAEMEAEGHGEQPAPFAWIGMGSEGREAQTITTDQDNGLIYEDVPEDQQAQVEAWFSVFAGKVVAALEACGFDLCNGNVMATNPDLRGSVTHWRGLFDRIITNAGDEDLFEACIYLDFRILYGKEALVDAIRAHVMEGIAARPFFLRHLVETTVQGTRPPVRTLRWKLYRATGIGPPRFDIKKAGLMPLDSTVRVLALLDGITATSTLERLQASLKKGRMSLRLADQIRTAFDVLLRMRFSMEFSATGPNRDEKHLVDIRSLPPAQARYLHDALSAVLELQEFVYEQVVGRKMHWNIT